MAKRPNSPYPDTLGFFSVHVPYDNSQYLFKIERKEDYPYEFRLRGSGLIHAEQTAHHMTIDAWTEKTPDLVAKINSMPKNWHPFKGRKRYATWEIKVDGQPYNALLVRSNFDPDNIVVYVDDNQGSALQFTFSKMHANPWGFIIGVLLGIIIAVTAVGLVGMTKSIIECTPSTTEVEVGAGGGDNGLFHFEFSQTIHCTDCVDDHYGGANPNGDPNK